MRKLVAGVVAAVLVPALPLAAQVKGPPAGWFAAGSAPAAYEISVDSSAAHAGRASAYIKGLSASARPSGGFGAGGPQPVPSGFGTLMQAISADNFAGKRVRMSGYAKAAGVSGWAGFWMRVDGPAGRTLAFDNMQSRPIKGTSDWTRYEIVLDVPQGSVDIMFGVLQEGLGQTWIDDLNFEVVPTSVRTTGPTMGGAQGGAPQYGPTPTNLTFDRP